ncbi:bifunctional folylpolyglutamate synthase/dihydrofolate synthase, partial [Candidatus Parvarchaeota archaeon]|nr:bifunctional folylpolyglutamate synthase/dihydrofolate synthase [Candidatus Parvarchaeota archaeon]
MGYASALKSLLSLKKHGYKFGLKRMRALCRLLGNPQEKYRVVHVAGTNGKGSTTVFCANMLQCAGFKVGCFTSPFLDYFEEQIKVNGKAITKPELAQCIYKVLPLAKKLKCSFFEAHTACALLYFASRKIDAAVVEVGLGGRLDATNVVKADVAVITQIGLEHTDLLGDTLGKIAREKAGIIKNGSLVITGVKNAQALAQIKK